MRRAFLAIPLLLSVLALSAGSAGGVPTAGAAVPTFDPAACGFTVEVVMWTGNLDYLRLARALAADPTPCAEYYITVPQRATPKTQLRDPARFADVRDLGPQFHPLAEVTLGSQTGWAKWVAAEPGRTWYQAGVEFRRRMQAAGLDPTRGETWLLNEFDRSTMRDATARDEVEIRQGLDVLPYRRADMLELLRGLYEGDGTVPPAAGAVEIGINFSHQNRPDVPAYKAELAAWLEDGAFWSGVDHYTRWLLREAYPDTRNWGVAGTSREERREHLADYLFHTLELAEAGPATVEPARALFRRAYTPLANAGWAAFGGDEFEFVTGHGSTMVPPEQMMAFVSEQVYAIRRYAGNHTQGAPQGRLGFSWQPFNRWPPPTGLPPAEYEAALDAITARIASAIHYAYRQGGASPAGACAPPGGERDWCDGADVPGAAFTEAWDSFSDWP
jgi:hypothetical protein